MPTRFALAILATALSISPVTAQIRDGGSGTTGFGISAGPAGTGHGATAGSPGHTIVGSAARFRLHHGNSSGRSVLLPYPYFYADTDSGYDSPEASQPQVIVVQGSASAVPPAPPVPRESLLIEWQGDHFVRTTRSANAAAGGQIAPDYSEKSALTLPVAGRSVPARKHAVEPPPQLPPAVLVFRDGRREEVSEYTIMSGAIYSKADYWTTGSWTRKIEIADLDVPATLKLNQERGLKFVLPSSPNEIVTRP